MIRVSHALEQTVSSWGLPWATVAMAQTTAAATDHIYASTLDHLLILGTAGVAGSFVNATFFPRENWRLRIRQGVASAITAMCIGGLLGAIVNGLTGQEFWSFVACGFVAGFGPREVISAIQSFLQKQTK